MHITVNERREPNTEITRGIKITLEITTREDLVFMRELLKPSNAIKACTARAKEGVENGARNTLDDTENLSDTLAQLSAKMSGMSKYNFITMAFINKDNPMSDAEKTTMMEMAGSLDSVPADLDNMPKLLARMADLDRSHELHGKELEDTSMKLAMLIRKEKGGQKMSGIEDLIAALARAAEKPDTDA